MMHSIDRKGELLQVSNFWAEKLGYSPDEMIGKKSTEFLMPEYRRYAAEEVLPKFFRDGRVHNVAYQFRKADGSPLDVLMSAVAQNDADGKFSQSLAVLFDNSEAKRAMALLQQKQRAEALGRMVSGVAHDFNNALAVIQGSLELLQDNPAGPDSEIQLLDALRATRRAASMTKQLLMVGKQSDGPQRETHLNEFIRTTESVMSRLLPQNIHIETNISSGLWPVRLDPHELDTAMLNLANNAKQAMPEGGKLILETSNIRLREDNIREGQETIPAGRYTMLAVTDTGAGIPRDIQDRIFEPYFTTHDGEWSSGMGLGLSMVQGFIKNSGGYIRVDSEVNFGTTVKMFFPASAKAQSNGNFRDGLDESDDLMCPDRAEVLVVEDEDDVRRVLVAQLKALGYRVAEATNGDFALTLFESGFKPRVMFSDVVMPGKNQGAELAGKAKAHVPDLKIVFISGYADTKVPQTGTADLFLSKPVSRGQLAAALKDMVR